MKKACESLIGFYLPAGTSNSELSIVIPNLRSVSIVEVNFDYVN